MYKFKQIERKFVANLLNTGSCLMDILTLLGLDYGPTLFVEKLRFKNDWKIKIIKQNFSLFKVLCHVRFSFSILNIFFLSVDI